MKNLSSVLDFLHKTEKSEKNILSQILLNEWVTNDLSFAHRLDPTSADLELEEEH